MVPAPGGGCARTTENAATSWRGRRINKLALAEKENEDKRARTGNDHGELKKKQTDCSSVQGIRDWHGSRTKNEANL